MTTLIDGKKIAQLVINDVTQGVVQFVQQYKLSPALAVILIGDDPASQVYVRNKIKRAHEVGIVSVEHRLGDDCTEQTLLQLIDSLNKNPKVHGILVQLPLPKHIDEETIIHSIAADKDVDGFHPLNVGALHCGKPTLVPCTPLGCVILLKQHCPDLNGLHAVVIGRSNIVGKPMAALLLKENCTVTTVHSRTQNIETLCSQADIVVAAIGMAEYVKSKWIKPGAIVIDVGINAIERDGRRVLVGDVDFADIEPIASAITPVPGGVGPMTIACLMKNTLMAAHALEEKR